jgi:hypothetical protein
MTVYEWLVFLLLKTFTSVIQLYFPLQRLFLTHALLVIQIFAITQLVSLIFNGGQIALEINVWNILLLTGFKHPEMCLSYVKAILYCNQQTVIVKSLCSTLAACYLLLILLIQYR